MRRFTILLSILGLTICAIGSRAMPQQPAPQLAVSSLTAQAPQPYQPPSPKATAEELEARGDQLRSEKGYEDAIDYYRAGISRTRSKPARAQLYNKIGVASLQMQDLRGAQKNFEHALKNQKNLAEARNNLGATFYLQRRYDRAISEYTEAIKLSENDASFHNNLATAYFVRKEYALAMSEYRHAFQLDPAVFERNSQTGVSARLSSPQNRAEYFYLLAKMYAQSGDIPHSIQYLKKAMEDGYKNIDNVYKDAEFSSLRKDPRFTDLMAAKPVAITE